MVMRQAPEEAVPKIQAILQSGGCCRLHVTGTSMVPFLRSEKDAVILKPFDKNVRRGDLLFYKRKNGQYILHRVHMLCGDGSYLLCGDNQTALEPVKQEQIIASIAAIERSGKQFPQDHLLWRLLSRIWIGLFFMRTLLLKLMHGLWKILKG